MKLFVFHGPGSAALNSKISDVKKGFDKSSITEVDGKEISEQELQNILSQGSLFAEKKLVILDNPSGLSLHGVIPDEVTLVLKFPKILPSNSTVLKEALKRGAQIAAFPEEKESTIFPFLDALTSRNPKAFLLLKTLYKEYGGQYLLTMIAFALRRLVNPPKNLPTFVIRKIEDQRKNFTQDTIKKLYRAILEEDFKIKSGILEEEDALILLSQRFFE